MTDRLRGGPVLDNKLVASLCEILISAAVPNLLWGKYLLTVYGVPTNIDDVGFVVPDDKIGRASSALEEAGYVLCPEGVTCPFVYGCLAPVPSEHFHINQDMIISWYQKSEMLWRIEDFDSAGFKDPENVISASDPRLPPSVLGRGQGRLSPEFSCVKIPTAVKHYEAMIFLHCRDHGTIYEFYWLTVLSYILEFVDGTDMLDGKDLSEEYQGFYCALRDGDSDTWPLRDKLRHKLMSTGWLQASFTGRETGLENFFSKMSPSQEMTPLGNLYGDTCS